MKKYLVLAISLAVAACQPPSVSNSDRNLDRDFRDLTSSPRSLRDGLLGFYLKHKRYPDAHIRVDGQAAVVASVCRSQFSALSQENHRLIEMEIAIYQIEIGWLAIIEPKTPMLGGSYYCMLSPDYDILDAFATL